MANGENGRLRKPQRQPGSQGFWNVDVQPFQRLKLTFIDALRFRVF
jgi:hypothetical protein